MKANVSILAKHLYIINTIPENPRVKQGLVGYKMDPSGELL